MDRYENPGCGGVTIAGIIFLLLVLLSGCKTKYITVPEYHSVYVDKHDTLVRIDSIYEKDSVLVMVNGDTVTIYKTKVQYKDRWREKIIYRDSLRTDTISVPYPVEKKLSKWAQFKQKTGGIALIFSAFLFIYFMFMLLKGFRARNQL